MSCRCREKRPDRLPARFPEESTVTNPRAPRIMIIKERTRGHEARRIPGGGMDNRVSPANLDRRARNAVSRARALPTARARTGDSLRRGIPTPIRGVYAAYITERSCEIDNPLETTA